MLRLVLLALVLAGAAHANNNGHFLRRAATGSTVPTLPPSTSTSSTSTSTSSTSTSTTLSTAGQGLWFPTTQMPATAINQVWQAVNTIRCARFVPRRSITGATELAWGAQHNSVFDVGIALYASDGSSRIATTGNVSTPVSGGNVKSVTGIPAFNLVAGTPYLVCWCSTSVDGFFRSANTLGEIAAGQTGIYNAFVANVMTSTSVCAAGAPPTSVTGLAGAGAAVWSVPALYISKE